MKYLFFALLAISLTSCIKDKLEKDTLVMEGTWKWVHSIEYTYDAANDTTTQMIVPASNYPDSYAIRFEKKGRVYTIKNNEDQDKYRLVMPYFKSGLCTLNNGYEYEIHLNNKEDNILSGCVSEDTLITDDFHLPLSQNDPNNPVYYKHVYVK